MSKENTNKDTKKDTDTGVQDLTTDEKLDNLARNVFILKERQKDAGLAIDNIYIQVATMIEILADKEILNEKLWEEKLREVTQNIKDTMEAMANEAGNNNPNNGNDPDRPDASQGSGKIITPDSRIIIPGQ